MNRLFVFAVLPLFLLACGGSEPDFADAQESDPVFLPLEQPSASTPAIKAATEEPVKEVSAFDASSQEGEKVPIVIAPVQAPAPLDSRAALQDLSKWHRGTSSERAELLRAPSSSAAGIRSLARVWEGEADTYRSSLRTAVEGAFGVDFERFAASWAEKGIPGLQGALAEGPVGSTAHLVWTDVLAESCLAKDDYASAGKALGSLLGGMMESGYSRERILELVPRITLIGRNVNTFIPYDDYKVVSGDSYWVICRAFRKQGLLVNQGWIADFNHKRNYSLREGENLKIPQAKLSVSAWRGKRLLAIYADDIPVRLYAVSMGRKDAPTPLGTFTLSICEPEPVYYPPGGSPVPYSNPDNPLGERWLGFKEDRQYGLHGTNSEETIGSYESGGCVRMHNEDVVEVFELLCPGIEVTISA